MTDHSDLIERLEADMTREEFYKVADKMCWEAASVLRAQQEKIDRLTRLVYSLNQQLDDAEQDSCDVDTLLWQHAISLRKQQEIIIWYAKTVEKCNLYGLEGDAARDALAKDLGKRAYSALTEDTS